jgi:hypothetical protein
MKARCIYAHNSSKVQYLTMYHMFFPINETCLYSINVDSDNIRHAILL